MDAEPSYRTAIDQLDRSGNRTELARGHLLFGEWLRSRGRLREAREQLRAAEEMFAEIGMEAFAERTRAELVAAGAKPRAQPAEARAELTPQEEQIARLARDGLTNAQIGAQLFLSPRTVEWHLNRVFGKLRDQLARCPCCRPEAGRAGSGRLTAWGSPMVATRGPGFVGRSIERDCSMDFWRGSARVRARRWSSAARRASARPRCCATPHARRPASRLRSSPASRPRWSCRSRECISCAPRYRTEIDALPAPQREALTTALGLVGGKVPERFLVGLAVLSLLSAVAEERPMLCLVEDAQWLDAASAQVVGLVARRVRAESVAIVVAVREPADGHDFDGLPELRLDGLPEQDAGTLLASVVTGRLDSRIADRIVAETRGNPLALLELPARMTAAELAGFELPGAVELPAHIEDHYLRRIRELPEATQHLMLVAAAEPLGDPEVVLRAARRLDIEAGALGPAETAELLAIGKRVQFRHPLVRSAVYRAAPPASRQRVHEVLAEVSHSAADADRRAWHRALAADGPRRGRRRRARAVSRPRTGSWWGRRNGGLPAARRRSDP